MENNVLEQIVTQFGDLPEPISLSGFHTELRTSGIKIGKAKLNDLLNNLVAQSRAVRHPPARNIKNASTFYFSKSPLRYIEELLFKTLQHYVECTVAQLRDEIPKAYQEQFFDEALGNLKNEGILFERHKNKRTYLTLIPPQSARPSDYLNSQRKKSLQETLNIINQHRRTDLNLEALLAFLDGESLTQSQRIDQELSKEQLVTWYGEDLEKRGGLRSMPIPWTWKRYLDWCTENGFKPNRDRFHELLKDMANRSSISLTSHDSPYNLPKEEVDILQTNQKGHPIYYWTILG